jgi:molybdopterin synthase sulfur carrier subunit
MKIRVVLPYHLRNLAQVGREVEVELSAAPTLGAALDAVEAAYPVLRGTIREHDTLKRRAFIRYFACGQDLSHEPPETPLPGPVQEGTEPLRVVGAMAGG